VIQDQLHSDVEASHLFRNQPYRFFRWHPRANPTHDRG
jgi:hypothetical protein